MSPLVRRLMRLGNRVMTSLYRRSGGRIGGRAKGGAAVALLTVAGRRTGQPHTTPVTVIPYAGGHLVIGSANGSPEEPQWFRNLRATDHAELELGTSRTPVAVRVLEGEDRETVWREVVVPGYRFFAAYEDRSAGRRMPVAHLTPTA